MVDPPGFPVPVALSSAVDPRLIEHAGRELLGRTGGSGTTWGYVLGVEDALRTLPAMATIDAELRAQLPDEFALSFAKVAVGTTPAASEGVHFAGFHLDTHPLITADDGTELERVLVSVAAAPRSVLFARATRFDLARRGVPVHRGDYQVVAIPDDIARERIVIPARAAGRVHGLRFTASLVPHVGIDDDGGYFLVSYERRVRFPVPVPA